MRPAPFLKVAHHLGERTAGAACPGRLTFALLARAVLGDLAGAGLGVDHRDAVARLRRAVEPEDLDGNGGARLLDGGAGIADERADAAPLGTGDHDVARVQGAALDEHRRHGTTAAVEFRFDHGAFRLAVGIGLQLEDFGLELQAFEQRLETIAGLG